MSNSNAKTVDNRTRNWCFIFYPESCPENWKEILENEHIPLFVSPLHDADKNADETEKKAHYHCLMKFNGKKSQKQVQEIANKVNGTLAIVCKDLRSYARYLCHLDNPEKAQYLPSNVISLGGLDYLELISSAADVDTALSEMMDWCIEQGCFSFYRLSNYARRERTDWFRVLSSSRTVFLTNWLKSMKWEIDNGGIIE